MYRIANCATFISISAKFDMYIMARGRPVSTCTVVGDELVINSQAQLFKRWVTHICWNKTEVKFSVKVAGVWLLVHGVTIRRTELGRLLCAIDQRVTRVGRAASNRLKPKLA
jgi:hypothetical protein